MRVNMNSESIGLTAKDAQEKSTKYGSNVIQEFKKIHCLDLLNSGISSLQ